MLRFLMHWLTVTIALSAAVWLLPGVVVDSTAALLIAALVLGFINGIVRPVLVILTLPITVLTLGLFYLVVNGVAFLLAAFLVPGFEVSSFGAAVLGALIVSLVSWFVSQFGRSDGAPPTAHHLSN